MSRIFYSVDEVADLWGCNRDKVREYCQTGTIRAHYVRGEWRIEAKGLDEYELRTTGRVPFKKVCMYCGKQYGVKYDKPPAGYEGKEELLQYGVCDKCELRSKAVLFG